MYVCVYIYTHTHKYTYGIHRQTHAHKVILISKKHSADSVEILKQAYIFIDTYTRIYTQMCTHIYIHTYGYLDLERKIKS